MTVFRALALVFLVACGSPPTQPSAPVQPTAPAAPEGEKGKKAKQGKTKAPVEKTPVKLFFLDDAKFAAGAPEAIVSVERSVGTNNPPRNALWFLFKGPDAAEEGRGLSFVASGTEGFTKLEVKDGTAHVTLKGGCASGGATLTVYDLIVPTLKQFPNIHHVKVYSEDGQTADPAGETDSRPACLEP